MKHSVRLAALLAAALAMSGCVEPMAQNGSPAPVEALADAPQPALAEGSPAQVGMSAERLARITAMTQRYVDEKKLAGVVTMVARKGRIVHFEAVGQRGAATEAPMTKDALFRIYSMSKPITAVAAMMLYEEGAFQLSDPVAKFVPELADLKVLLDGETLPAKETMTMHHLLTHTAGLSYGFNPRGNPVDQLYREAQPLAATNLTEFAERLGTLPLVFEPGDRWHYSVAVDVTGLVVERLSGQSFDVFLQERIFAPLGMVDTFFNVPPEKVARFLPNHNWNRQENKLVELGEQAFTSYANTEMFSGGGGLVSTAMDYMRFAEMVRRGGELDGVRLLSPKTVEFMTADHLPATVTAAGSGENPGRGGGAFGFGLGFGVNTNVPASGVMGSVGEYSWGGAAGTIFWVDPVEDMVVVGMIQLMGSPWPLRAELKVLVNQAIVEQA